MKIPLVYNPMHPIFIKARLEYPKDPCGRCISWKHPYLIMLAENGTIAANEEHEAEVTRDFQEFLKTI